MTLKIFKNPRTKRYTIIDVRRGLRARIYGSELNKKLAIAKAKSLKGIALQYGKVLLPKK